MGRGVSYACGTPARAADCPVRGGVLPPDAPTPSAMNALPADPHAPPQSLLDLGRILLRHRKKAVAFFVVAVALVGTYTALCSRKYSSQAKLFVKVGRETVTLDPTATTGQMLSLYESRESEVNSVLDVIRSRVLLDAIVDALGPRLTKKDLRIPAEREELIRALEKSIETFHTKSSSVITISCRGKSPELAQATLDIFLKAFLEEHMRINRTEGSYEFFVEQADLLHRQLEQATAALRDAKNAAGLATIDGQRETIQRQLQTVDTELLTSQSALAASEAMLAALHDGIDGLAGRPTEEIAFFPDDAVSNVRKQLYDLRIREQELLARYAAEHPQVRGIRQQIEQAQSLLHQHGSPEAQSVDPANPARQQLYLKLLSEESAADSLRAKIETLRQQRTRIEGELQRLNASESRLALLQQQVDLLSANYRAYAEKLEVARIGRALEKDRISNVNIVQPPSLVPKPVSPQIPLNMALGVLFGLAGGIGLAFLCEYLHPAGPGTSDESSAHPLLAETAPA